MAIGPKAKLILLLILITSQEVDDFMMISNPPKTLLQMIIFKQYNTFTREIKQVSMHCDTVLLNLCKNKKVANVVLP